MTVATHFYRVTSLDHRSVRVQHHLRRPSRDQTVVIDRWYTWGQGFIAGDIDLSTVARFVECDVSLGYLVESNSANHFTWNGDHWNEKSQHRIQKDLLKGGVDRIIEMQASWQHIETKLWINAPFQIDQVDAANLTIVTKSNVSYKGQIKT
jgi:hypothetical protein